MRERERESTVLGVNVLIGLAIAENVKGSLFLVIERERERERERESFLNVQNKEEEENGV